MSPKREHYSLAFKPRYEQFDLADENAVADRSSHQLLRSKCTVSALETAMMYVFAGAGLEA